MTQFYPSLGKKNPLIVAIGAQDKLKSHLLHRIVERIGDLIPEKLASFCHDEHERDTNGRYAALLLDIDCLNGHLIECIKYYRLRNPSTPLILVYETAPLTKELIVSAYAEGVSAIVYLKKELFSLDKILKAAIEGSRIIGVSAIEHIVDFAIQKHNEEFHRAAKPAHYPLTHLEKVVIMKIKEGKSNKTIVAELKQEGTRISEDKLKREIIPRLYEIFHIPTGNIKKVQARQLLISKLNII